MASKCDIVIISFNAHRVLVEQGCTTQISWRAKKMLLTHSRARLVKFFPFYIVFTSKIKPNVRKLGLWGPD